MGVFITFKIFDEVFYSAKMNLGAEVTSTKNYRYDPFAPGDNLIEVPAEDGASVHRFDKGLSVLMRLPKAAYESYFDSGNPLYEEVGQWETVASALLNHFLIEFVQKKVPKLTFLSVNGGRENLHEHFNKSLRAGGFDSKELEIGQKKFVFDFSYFKVSESQANKHRLYFYANNRAASDLEKISSGVNSGPFSEVIEEEFVRYYYLVAISREYFISSQSRDRIINLGEKININGKKKTVKDCLIAIAKQHILQLEADYTSTRRAKMAADIEHLIAIDPLLRRGLGEKSVEEVVLRRSITESREQLAQDLFVERFRRKFDFTKLDQNFSLDLLVDLVQTQIPADAKEALAVYVAYRNHVITLFRQLLKKQESGLATEDKVHSLIYPRYRDSEEIDYSAHNIWLLDDDLAYAQYISSDRTPDGNQRAKGQFAHDLLINNQNELMVVEMKRPQKTGYAIDSQIPTNHPVDQIKKQISDIRRRGKIKTSSGREIEIPADKMVRGYVLADWNDSLQSYLEMDDFVATNYGGQMAYKYFKTLNFMLKVLAFDRLVDRAANRNEAFKQILEGRSNYDRKPKGTLDILSKAVGAK